MVGADEDRAGQLGQSGEQGVALGAAGQEQAAGAGAALA